MAHEVNKGIIAYISKCAWFLLGCSSFQCIKGRGLRYPAYGMAHITYPLLPIIKFSPCYSWEYDPCYIAIVK